MFVTMRRHHHPADAWEPDDADEVAEEVILEEIRHCGEWDPAIDPAVEPPMPVRYRSSARRKREYIHDSEAL